MTSFEQVSFNSSPSHGTLPERIQFWYARLLSFPTNLNSALGGVLETFTREKLRSAMHLQHCITLHHLNVMSVVCVRRYFYALTEILMILKVQYEVPQTIWGAYVENPLHND